jgi:hypothetical protein
MLSLGDWEQAFQLAPRAAKGAAAAGGGGRPGTGAGGGGGGADGAPKQASGWLVLQRVQYDTVQLEVAAAIGVALTDSDTSKDKAKPADSKALVRLQSFVNGTMIMRSRDSAPVGSTYNPDNQKLEPRWLQEVFRLPIPAFPPMVASRAQLEVPLPGKVYTAFELAEHEALLAKDAAARTGEGPEAAKLREEEAMREVAHEEQEKRVAHMEMWDDNPSTVNPNFLGEIRLPLKKAIALKYPDAQVLRREAAKAEEDGLAKVDPLTGAMVAVKASKSAKGKDAEHEDEEGAPSQCWQLMPLVKKNNKLQFSKFVQGVLKTRRVRLMEVRLRILDGQALPLPADAARPHLDECPRGPEVDDPADGDGGGGEAGGGLVNAAAVTAGGGMFQQAQAQAAASKAAKRTSMGTDLSIRRRPHAKVVPGTGVFFVVFWLERLIGRTMLARGRMGATPVPGQPQEGLGGKPPALDPINPCFALPAEEFVLMLPEGEVYLREGVLRIECWHRLKAEVSAEKRAEARALNARLGAGHKKKDLGPLWVDHFLGEARVAGHELRRSPGERLPVRLERRQIALTEQKVAEAAHKPEIYGESASIALQMMPNGKRCMRQYAPASPEGEDLDPNAPAGGGNDADASSSEDDANDPAHDPRSAAYDPVAAAAAASKPRKKRNRKRQQTVAEPGVPGIGLFWTQADLPLIGPAEQALLDRKSNVVLDENDPEAGINELLPRKWRWASSELGSALWVAYAHMEKVCDAVLDARLETIERDTGVLALREEAAKKAKEVEERKRQRHLEKERAERIDIMRTVCDRNGVPVPEGCSAEIEMIPTKGPMARRGSVVGRTILKQQEILEELEEALMEAMEWGAQELEEAHDHVLEEKLAKLYGKGSPKAVVRKKQADGTPAPAISEEQQARKERRDDKQKGESKKRDTAERRASEEMKELLRKNASNWLHYLAKNNKLTREQCQGEDVKELVVLTPQQVGMILHSLELDLYLKEFEHVTGKELSSMTHLELEDQGMAHKPHRRELLTALAGFKQYVRRRTSAAARVTRRGFRIPASAAGRPAPHADCRCR